MPPALAKLRIHRLRENKMDSAPGPHSSQPTENVTEQLASLSKPTPGHTVLLHAAPTTRRRARVPPSLASAAASAGPRPAASTTGSPPAPPGGRPPRRTATLSPRPPAAAGGAKTTSRGPAIRARRRGPRPPPCTRPSAAARTACRPVGAGANPRCAGGSVVRGPSAPPAAGGDTAGLAHLRGERIEASRARASSSPASAPVHGVRRVGRCRPPAPARPAASNRSREVHRGIAVNVTVWGLGLGQPGAARPRS